jgi:hypothetical protein
LNALRAVSMLEPKVTVCGSPWKLLWKVSVVPAATVAAFGK